MAKTPKRKSERLMRLTEAASTLGIARSTLRNRVWQGVFTAEDHGGVTFLIRAEIEAAAREKKRAA